MRIPIEEDPLGITLTPNGEKAYVANNRSNSVSVIGTSPDDLGTYHRVIATIPVGADPEWIAIRGDKYPARERAYVTCEYEVPGKIWVIRTQSDTVETSIAVGINPEKVVLTPDLRRIYVANEGSKSGSNGSVSVIGVDPDDALTYHQVIDTIHEAALRDDYPEAINVIPAGEYAGKYVLVTAEGLAAILSCPKS